MEQMKNRKEHEAAEKFANGLADEFRAFWADEDGVGVIEVVLILVGNIYPLIHAIYYVDTVEIVEIEKQYKQECV